MSAPISQADARPVVIMAGGTGGHIFPGLAVARELRARGVPVTWLGAAGAMETRLVPPQGIAIDTLPIAGIRGKGKLALLGAPFRIMRAVRAAGFALRARNPRAVVAFGGFASGPGGLAGRLLGVPLIVHEQNRAPGMTNRILARFCRRLLVGFPGSFAVAALAGQAQFQIRHQSGEKLFAEAQAAYQQADVAAEVSPFIADMAQAFAWADLVVCRAGASTLAELCAVGVPAVLVPFAAAVDDHQTRNAQYLVEHGAAVLLKQDAGLAAALQQTLQQLHDDPARRMAMAQAARGLARVDAAARIADIILEESTMTTGNGNNASGKQVQA